MRSLRLRLFGSYLIILLLTLVVTGVALFILLAARPVPNAAVVNTLGIQLNALLGTVENEGGDTIPIEKISRVQRQQIGNYATKLNVRALIRRADGMIVFDSVGALKPERIKLGDKIEFRDQTYKLPAVNGPQAEPFVRGIFRSPRGDEWLYVGQAVDLSRGPEAHYLLFATNAPRITIDQLWQFYGSDILFPLVQAGVIGLVVALIFAILIARSVARPLQDVADTAHAVALGQRDQKAPVRGPREVRMVAEAFNAMVTQVEDSQQAQRDFLANVSHDLRTPLTSIQGYSQAIMEGIASTPETTARAAQTINAEAARMYRMVEELLDLARIEAGKMTMQRHKIQIGDLVRAIGERMKLNAEKKSLTLRLQIDPELPILAGDGDRLSQVLMNLVENALKHTPSGGVITLGALAQEGGVLLTVHDTGEGIPAVDLPRIFERFYQVDKSRQRRDGAGLGLQICYQIVQAHGGKIWAESKEGQWTRFNVWLPATPGDSTSVIRRRTLEAKPALPRKP